MKLVIIYSFYHLNLKKKKILSRHVKDIHLGLTSLSPSEERLSKNLSDALDQAILLQPIKCSPGTPNYLTAQHHSN